MTRAAASRSNHRKYFLTRKTCSLPERPGRALLRAIVGGAGINHRSAAGSAEQHKGSISKLLVLPRASIGLTQIPYLHGA